MSILNDGGPAFPHHSTHECVGDCSGMTMRDYFAAKAMQGLTIGNFPRAQIIAQTAYQIADAMIAARKGNP